jgi:hypothetical protein
MFFESFISVLVAAPIIRENALGSITFLIVKKNLHPYKANTFFHIQK